MGGVATPKTQKKIAHQQTQLVVDPAEAKFKTRLITDSHTEEDRRENWRKCVNLRLIAIRDPNANLKNTFDTEWPQYKQAYGYRYVSKLCHFINFNPFSIRFNFGSLVHTRAQIMEDFDYLYPNIDSDCLLNGLAAFATKMLMIILPSNIKKRTKPDSFQLLQKAQENIGVLDDVEEIESITQSTAMYLMHDLFTHTARKPKENAYVSDTKRRKRDDTTDRCDVSDSQDSFLKFHENFEEYRAYYDAMVLKNKSVPPMINAIGSVLSSDPRNEYYVDFDNIRYKMPSLACAIDVCFKAFYLFDIEFPPACQSFWQFINAHFYKIATVSPMHKSVKHLQEQFNSESNFSFRIIYNIYTRLSFRSFISHFVLFSVARVISRIEYGPFIVAEGDDQ